MIYIVVVFLALLLLISIKKRFWAPAVFLIAVYLFSLVFSVILLQTTNEYRVDLLSCIIFVVEFSLLASPFFVKKPRIEPCNNPVFLRFFRMTGMTLGGIIIVCMLFLIPYVQEVFFIGLADARSASVEGELVVQFVARSIPAYAYALLRCFYPLSYAMLLMFFYSLSFYSQNKLLNVVLFLSSFAGIFIGIFDGGRTNLMYWVMAFNFLLIIFFPYLSSKKKAGLFSISGIFVGVLVLYFIIVSTARFGDYDTESSLVRYTGTPFLNFCEFIQKYHVSHFSLRRVFPFLSEVISGPMSIMEYRDIIYQKSHMDIGLFYTLLGDLYVDLGLVGMFIYTVVYNRITKKSMNKHVVSLSNLLIFLVLYLIPLQGLFYYSYWRSVVTLCSIGVVVYALYIKKTYHA